VESFFFALEKIATAALLLFGAHGRAGLVDFADELDEDVVDVDFGFGRALNELASPFGGEFLSLFGRDNTLVVQVALVAGEHDGHVVAVLDTGDLVADVCEVVEGGLGDSRIDQDETLAIFHVQVAHGGELFGTSRIQDFQHALVSVNFELFAVRIFNRGVILFDEDALHELHSQGRFSDTTRAEDDQFVFAHFGGILNKERFYTKSNFRKFRRFFFLGRFAQCKK